MDSYQTVRDGLETEEYKAYKSMFIDKGIEYEDVLADIEIVDTKGHTYAVVDYTWKIESEEKVEITVIISSDGNVVDSEASHYGPPKHTPDGDASMPVDEEGAKEVYGDTNENYELIGYTYHEGEAIPSMC